VTDQETANAIALLIGIFSPVIVEALKRDHWKPAQVQLLGLTVATVIYVGLHALLGTLTFPLTPAFLINLVAVFGLQQASYSAYFKDRNRVELVPTHDATSDKTTVIVGDVNKATG
jgi:hypothetical protein